MVMRRKITSTRRSVGVTVSFLRDSRCETFLRYFDIRAESPARVLRPFLSKGIWRESEANKLCLHSV